MTNSRFNIGLRGTIAFAHDLFMAALSFVISMYLRYGSDAPRYFSAEDLIFGSFVLTLVCAFVFLLMGLYRGVWRYASTRDLVAITKTASIAVSIFFVVMFVTTRMDIIPRSVPIINWFVLMALLGGPRFLYRIAKDKRLDLHLDDHVSKKIPVLLVGAGDGAELFLRALQRNPQDDYICLGIVTEKRSRVGLDIHGVRVLGMLSDFETIIDQLKSQGKAPHKIILTQESWDGAKIRDLLERVDALGLTLARLPRLTDLKSGATDRVEIKQIDVQDLLGRPQAALDKNGPKNLLGNKRVLITGAGGSIGSELVRQIASYGPAEITLLEASELALYSIDMEISKTFPGLLRHTVICNIRDRHRLDAIFTKTKPDFVFHAAALKHVPLVEENIIEGVMTNALGSRNVADACIAHKVKAMVQISTDKVVNPTNYMGATKRIAECYTQALDVECGQSNGPRFVTVRFGNVLGSTGSVVPLFQKQLAEGGPITVTHPDMTRYFMTIREAVELVLQASVLGSHDHDLEGKICVLDMGKPVKIIDLARQMIRLSGLRPEQDIEIKITGLRPGEKLFEEIFHGSEPPVPSSIDGVMIATPRRPDRQAVSQALSALEKACLENNIDEVQSIIQQLVPEHTTPAHHSS